MRTTGGPDRPNSPPKIPPTSPEPPIHDQYFLGFQFVEIIRDKLARIMSIAKMVRKTETGSIL